MPTPKAGENEQDFVSRCMGDAEMNDKHPDQKERAAVCYAFYERKKSMDIFTTGVFLKADEPKKPYGDVTYADPGYQEDGKKRYPIDTEAHIRAAWNYINKPKNEGQYSSEEVGKIKAKIVSAWKRVIDKDGPPAAQKNLGQSDSGLEMGLYEPDPVLNAIDAMVVPKPMGLNRTCLTATVEIQDGVAMPTCLNVYNMDIDPDGEEVPGSADEQREMEHYAAVMHAIAEWLLTGEESEEEDPTAKAKRLKDEETARGEQTDDVNDDGKPKGPKDAAVPAREDLEGGKKKKKDVEVSFA